MRIDYKFTAIQRPEGIEVTLITEMDTVLLVQSLSPMARKFFGFEPGSAIAKNLDPQKLEVLRLEGYDDFYGFSIIRHDRIIHARINNFAIWEESEGDWRIGREDLETKTFSLELEPIIKELPSFDAALELARHLRPHDSFLDVYVYCKDPVNDEEPTTNPDDSDRFMIGDYDEGYLACLDYQVLAYAQRIILHLMANGEDLEYCIVPFSEAIEVADKLVEKSLKWCIENKVHTFYYDGESFLFHVKEAIEQCDRI